MPETGERGYTGSGSSSYLGDPLVTFGKRRMPTVAQLHYMLSADPWGKALEGALSWPIRQAKWTIKKVDGDKGEADLVREQFKSIAKQAIAGCCSAIGRRVAYAEQVWDLEGVPAPGKSFPASRHIVLKDLAFRPQDQCSPNTDGNGRVNGFTQTAYVPGRGFIKESFEKEKRKAFVFFHDSATRPNTGTSAFDAAYQYFTDKEKVLFYRYKLLEKYGGPSTHGKTDAPAGSDARKSFEAAVKDARSGAAIVTGLTDEINYLAPPNAGEAFKQAIRDINFEMAVSCFIQQLALAQEGNSGAYALSRDHSDFLAIITEGRMSEIEDSFTNGPVRDITFWNFGPDAAFPTFDFEPFTDEQKQQVREMRKDLFIKNQLPIPDWLATGVVDNAATDFGIEKPERATMPVQDVANQDAINRTTDAVRQIAGRVGITPAR